MCMEPKRDHLTGSTCETVLFGRERAVAHRQLRIGLFQMSSFFGRRKVFFCRRGACHSLEETRADATVRLVASPAVVQTIWSRCMCASLLAHGRKHPHTYLCGSGALVDLVCVCVCVLCARCDVVERSAADDDGPTTGAAKLEPRCSCRPADEGGCAADHRSCQEHEPSYGHPEKFKGTKRRYSWWKTKWAGQEMMQCRRGRRSESWSHLSFFQPALAGLCAARVPTVLHHPSTSRDVRVPNTNREQTGHVRRVSTC